MQQRACRARPHLEAREELVGILVLAHIERLPIVVLERAPEAERAVPLLVAQRQVPKHALHAAQTTPVTMAPCSTL